MSAEELDALLADALSGPPGSPDSGHVACYVALGDSFTAGSGTSSGECWANRLAGALGDRVEYRNLARHGVTSGEVREQVRVALQLEPDLVSVVCGMNDLLFDRRLNLLAYSRAFGAILRGLRGALPGVRIFTATAPESWNFLHVGPRTRGRIERDAARLNQATRSLAASHRVAVLEVAGDRRLSDPASFCVDGLHPSPAGHAHAAREIADLLRSRFDIEVRKEPLE